MAKKAAKKSLEQLQAFFDFLGESGGTIETKTPSTWWKLTLEVEKTDQGSKEILIGVCKLYGDGVFADLLYDPFFSLHLKVHENRIIEGEIKGCINQTVFGTTEIDGDDMLYGFGLIEKASPGLQEKFSAFMDNITNVGPYLTDPKEVVRYDE